MRLWAGIFSSFKRCLNLEPGQLGVVKPVLQYFPTKYKVLRIIMTWSLLKASSLMRVEECKYPKMRCFVSTRLHSHNNYWSGSEKMLSAKPKRHLTFIGSSKFTVSSAVGPVSYQLFYLELKPLWLNFHEAVALKFRNYNKLSYSAVGTQRMQQVCPALQFYSVPGLSGSHILQCARTVRFSYFTLCQDCPVLISYSMPGLSCSHISQRAMQDCPTLIFYSMPRLSGSHIL